jgi:cyclophilin family peptidyl-prolyl cis-trans isomerase
MKRALVLAFTAILAIAAPAAAKKKAELKPVGTTSKIEDFLPPALTPDNTWDLDLSDGGRVVVQLRPDKAPLMVERIKTLTKQGFYNGLTFHRVIDGFMAQGGDPKGTGEGGSTLPDVKAEFNDLPHVRGAVAAARAADDNSANSQFYIMFLPNLKLDRHYTVFGRVVSGMDYADAITRGEPPANPTRVIRATMGDDPASATPPPAAMMAPAARAAPTGLPSGALPSGPVQPKASRTKKPR